jgi:hypothetical protein
MFPFVKFIRIGGENGEKPDVPRQQASATRADNQNGREQN